MKNCVTKPKKWYVAAPCCWCSPTGISLRSPAGSGSDGGWRDQTRLVEQSLRCDANIIVETASARDPHHFAVLLGFGATAIYPYLAYETLGRLVDTHAIAKDYRTVMLNYRNGINKGLYKIMSKMGISTIASYRCSKLFEAVGLHDDVVGLCFRGG